MAATVSIEPVSYNQIAIDYLCPKTATSDIYVRTAEAGTDYARFDYSDQAFCADEILEYTAASGVTIDGVLVKDGGITVSGDVIYSKTAMQILANTSDASDTKSISICGGGAAATSRGAFMLVDGNEGVTTGKAVLMCGSGASAFVQIGSETTRSTQIYHNNAAVVQVRTDGLFEFTSSYDHDISSKDPRTDAASAWFKLVHSGTVWYVPGYGA